MTTIQHEIISYISSMKQKLVTLGDLDYLVSNSSATLDFKKAIAKVFEISFGEACKLIDDFMSETMSMANKESNSSTIESIEQLTGTKPIEVDFQYFDTDDYGEMKRVSKDEFFSKTNTKTKPNKVNREVLKEAYEEVLKESYEETIKEINQDLATSKDILIKNIVYAYNKKFNIKCDLDKLTKLDNKELTSLCFELDSM